MNGDELIEYLEDVDSPVFCPSRSTTRDGVSSFNSNLASLVPTKEKYLLDNMVVYDVMIEQDRVHDSYTINEIEEDWQNIVKIVDEAENSDEKDLYTIKGFKNHFLNSGGVHSGYIPDKKVVDAVSEFFESKTTQINILDYHLRETTHDAYQPNVNDKKIASACADLDATWVTFDNDALAYRTDIEVTTPKRALKAWE